MSLARPRGRWDCNCSTPRRGRRSRRGSTQLAWPPVVSGPVPGVEVQSCRPGT